MKTLRLDFPFNLVNWIMCIALAEWESIEILNDSVTHTNGASVDGNVIQQIYFTYFCNNVAGRRICY